MMLAKFRHKYPHGSLVGELVEIDRGFYVVKVSIEVEKIVLATALAGASTVEAAEDAARERAIAALMLDDSQSTVSNNVTIDEPKSSEPSTASSEPPSEPQTNIVNFSKVSSEISTQPEDSITKEPASESILESTPIAPDIEPEIKPESNLFSGAFTTPVEDPAIDEETSAASANSNSAIATADLAEMDFNEIKQKTDIEIKRLGWTKDDGREFLKSRYGKRSRLHLTDEQLLEFLSYLEQQPTPVR
jgi:hypothetical protein